MKPKNQRLVLVVVALVAVLAAVLLAMWGLKDRAAYFYTPTDIAAGKAVAGKAMRLGGMVEKGSLKRLPDGVTIQFRRRRWRCPDAGHLSRYRPRSVPRRQRGRRRRAHAGVDIRRRHDPRQARRALHAAAARQPGAEHKAGETVSEVIAEAGLAALWLAAALSLLNWPCLYGHLRGWFDGARAIRSTRYCPGRTDRRRFCDARAGVRRAPICRSHWSRPTATAPSPSSTSSPEPGGITKARCCCG